MPRRYETTNHLWLILEYCVGGDLMSLLKRDIRLPENCIHDFGRDLAIALQVWDTSRQGFVMTSWSSPTMEYYAGDGYSHTLLLVGALEGSVMCSNIGLQIPHAMNTIESTQ